MENRNQGMQRACITLGVIVLIVGIVGSIGLAWFNGVTIETTSYFGVRKERSVILTLAWLIGGLFSTAIGTVILFSIGEILERLENVGESIQDLDSKINSINSKNNENDEILYNNSWKCPKCGRVNHNYTGTCACGYSK